MIDFGTYNAHYGYKKGLTGGDIRKMNSNKKLEATWYRDIQSKYCYLYDYYHDDEPTKFIGLKPEKSKTKIPIDIKFIVNRYNSDQKSQVPFSIQFKPSQKCNIPYYDDMFVRTCNAEFPLGLYIDIPDTEGVYRKWLIYQNGNRYNQFTTWFVLPCNYKFQWIANGKKYEMCGARRPSSSYSDGQEDGIKITTLDVSKTIWLPFNDISNTLEIDKRIIMGATTAIPSTWKITNVENIDFPGVNRISVCSDKFDRNTDFIEKDENGNVIGMWADFYKSAIEPINPDEPTASPDTTDHIKISYKGTSPTVKIGGSYKTLYVNRYSVDNEECSITNEVVWCFNINGVNLGADLIDIVYDSNCSIKIKFVGDYEYVNSIINVTATVDDLIDTIQLEVVGF